MKSIIRRFVLGDLIWWLIFVIMGIVVVVSPFIQSLILFDAIHLSIVVLLLVLIGLRSIMRQRVVLSNALLAVWLIVFSAFALAQAPRELFLGWFVVALVGAGVLFLRRAEF